MRERSNAYAQFVKLNSVQNPPDFDHLDNVATLKVATFLRCTSSLSTATENRDLRTPPYSIAHALPFSYGTLSASLQCEEEKVTSKVDAKEVKSTEHLSVRTQSRFITAAHVGFKMGFPLNSILTVTWSKFPESDWMKLHPYARAKTLLEKIRKFLTRARRKCPVAYIWVREAVANWGEHLHVALHLPAKYRSDFLEFLERVLGEAMAQYRRPIHERTKGEIACSESGYWHVGVEMSNAAPEFSGYWLAAYLAKSEPSQREFRGRLIENKLKQERGRAFGGRIKGEKYDASQGLIEGTTHRKGRFSISRSLQG